ncbi:MAG: hypothetical protein IT258_17485 [Saprospiraceae bacterium]|nr:hypothetical protein [Saprospiraceae bacterium]
MKSIRFFIPTLLLIAFAMQTSSAQRYLSENVDIALVKCQTVKLSKDLIQVNFTLRNNGKTTCKLADDSGEHLVSFITDGSSSKTPTLASFGDGSVRLAPDGITIKITELKPGETTTGSFQFSVPVVINHEEQLVSYLVTLDTERLGTDLNISNNAICGLIGK